MEYFFSEAMRLLADLAQLDYYLKRKRNPNFSRDKTATEETIRKIRGALLRWSRLETAHRKLLDKVN